MLCYVMFVVYLKPEHLIIPAPFFLKMTLAVNISF